MNGTKPSMVTPALVGGVILGVSSALPILEMLNCACCVLVIGGGVIASYLYIRDYPSHLPPVTYGEGALLGLLTGLIGGVVWAAVDIPLEYIKLQIGLGMMDMSEVHRALDNPEIPPFVREIVTRALQGGLGAGMILFQVITNLIISVIFATLGGILGVALFQKKVPPAPVQAQPQPPAPPTA